MRANLEAFRRRRLVPRMLRDVEARDLRVRLLGADLPAPLLLAPIGVQGIVHAEGELASARAASALGVPVVLSTAATRSIEEVAAACGDGPRWFQLYWSRDRDVVESLVGRAERAGYRRDRGHRRQPAPGLAPARPRHRLPAVPAGHRHRALPHRPGVPRPARAAARGGPAGRRRPVGEHRHQPGAGLGRPGLPARTYAAADPAQGHPAPRRRAPGVDAGLDGRRRLQSRRAPARRRRRDAGRAAHRGGGGARGLPGPVRQRHPHRGRHRQGAGPGAHARCCWAGPTCGASASPARRACAPCCGACWPTST